MPRLLLAALACLFVRSVLAQGASAALVQDANVDLQQSANRQNLLAALTQGSEVTLYTALPNGLIQVTRFRPPMALPRPQAEAAIAIARDHLRLLDIPYPTPDELARALAGGTIPSRDGPLHLPAVLPTAGRPAVVISQVVLANGLPVVEPPGGLPAIAAPGTAAAGGTTTIPRTMP